MVLGLPNAFGILRYVRPVASDLPPHHVTRWATSCFDHFGDIGLRVIDLKSERLDGPRFHWLLYWWDRACGVVRDQNSSWVQNFRRDPFWLMGHLTLHHCLGLLRRSGINELPVRGHSLYVLLSNHA